VVVEGVCGMVTEVVEGGVEVMDINYSGSGRWDNGSGGS
jgi:hypothetical protein